ncbi:MAG: FAD-dependent oxidoreductase [Desulfobacterales bacterium]|nr:FAD-dependent oxidoreductase [Desulfobacterales bacterium]
MKEKTGVKYLLLALVGLMIFLFFYLDLNQYISLANLKAHLDSLQNFYRENRLLSIGVYMVGYILMAALSLPGAAVVSLAGGAVFGLVTGVIVVSFASTIGATLAFLFSRYMFRDWVQNKFASKITTINQGIEREGGFYLFTLRLVPIFPFFVINLVMGLTPLKARTFYWVSQLGMFPGTVVYLNAGTQLATLESLGGILSPNILFSFVLLGLFPLVAKKLVQGARDRKIYAAHTKPKSFDYNLVVIGAGSAGLVSSYIAAAVKAKVALIEADKMGGDCLNTGCVPSKALIATAKLLEHARRADTWGLDAMAPQYEFSKIMDRVHGIIAKVEPHDSVERYTGLGVECIKGHARVISPWEVEVGERILTTRNIIIATGARPMVPPIPGLDQIDHYTSDTIWEIRELPERLVVLGAGPIGCELAQAFQRLGAGVTLVQRGDRIMQREDADAGKWVQDNFEKEGVDLRLEHSAEEVVVRDGQKILVCSHHGERVEIPFDQILVALGRSARITGFGLEELGVEIGPGNRIAANAFLQTNYPNIYCCGDVHGRYQFTHTAAHEAWYASVNALFGTFKKFRADYRVIPWATYTDPEVARVGLNEQDARAAGTEYELTIYGLDDLDRAIADSTDYGFVKVLTVPGKDEILGVTIVGNHAADIIAEYVLAMKYKIGLNKVLGTIHIYPTMAEANKYAAGVWKKAHAPEKLLAWVAKFHAWMRR